MTSPVLERPVQPVQSSVQGGAPFQVTNLGPLRPCPDFSLDGNILL